MVYNKSVKRKEEEFQMRKLSKKTKVELFVGKVVVLLIQSLLATGLFLGGVYVVGLVHMLLVENMWLLIPLAIYVLHLISKEI